MLLPHWASQIVKENTHEFFSMIRTYLNENPAYVNSRCELGKTPLHYAAESGAVETIKVLIEFGADVNASRRIQTNLGIGVGYLSILPLLLIL